MYPTDERWTEALLRRVKFRGEIWECAAGEGDMAKVLRRGGYKVRETDILTDGTDFLTQSTAWKGSIVTNPPYSLADEFIHRAIRLASEQVAMLLPIGSLGGQRRYKSLWGIRPPCLVISVVDRMPMVRGGHSQFNHVWCVWDVLKLASATTLIWEKA